MKRIAIFLLATASPLPVLAQSVEVPAESATEPAAQPATAEQPVQGEASPVATAQPAAADEYYGDEEEAIVIVGARPRGSVIGDIPAENVLDSRDIRATGATSISELLEAVESQTGSSRGRGGGRPVMLLNGQRISGFRELRDLPPEAIERMEILPEEVALKYGYSADQRVVNIVLRQRFRATTVEGRTEIATEGDHVEGRLDATRLTIRNNQRTSLNLQVGGNDALYESDRDISLNPLATVDERDARTLVGSANNVRLTGTHNRPLGESGGLTITGEAGIANGRSHSGLADYDDITRLSRDSKTVSLGLGSVANLTKGSWRLSATANADYSRSTSNSDRNLATVLTDDKSRSDRTSLVGDVTANGPLFTLPAGKASTTLKLGVSRVDLDSEARRRDIFTTSNLGRTQGDATANLDLPITKRDSTIGRLGLNLNAGISELSDFGTLTTYGGGLNWSPTSRLNLLTSYTREEGAPTLQQLGDPLVETDGVSYFDAVNGETVDVTTLSGGNPGLGADRRTVWKIGGNWRALEEPDLRLRAEFVSQRIDNPQIGFPAATPALEAAFPDRFIRDGAGNLVRVDLRPVNGAQSRLDQVRWGFEISKQLKSAVPSREQMQAMRERFMRGRAEQPAGGAAAPQGGAPATATTPSGTPPTDAPPPPEGQAGGPPPGGPGGGFRGPGGGGRGGGFFGGRNGGRLNFSLTHVVTLKDQLEIAPGLPVLDYLDGEAKGGTGGTSRHTIEARANYYNNGLGVRLGADWRSATRVNSASGPDLKFDDYATFDLRLFANLGERFDLVSKHPFLRGSSIRFEVENVFNARPKVRGADGIVPYAYEEDRLQPIGRVFEISFRKMFLPTRFRQRAQQQGGED